MGETRILRFTNPATGEVFGQVEMATGEAVLRARQEMRAAFPAWSAKPVEERVRILRKMQGVILDAADEITSIINQDCGKSRQDALIEVMITVDVLRVYLKHAANWLRRRQVSTGLYLFKRAFVEPRPYGVVGIISPWNYPFALSMPPVLAALLAGNTVLLKPSEVTGATGVLVQRLFERVPELAPFIRVLHGDGAVGGAMVQSKPDYIFLTGSTATGKKVLQAAAENLIPVACELGGKDAMIVLEDADIDAAAHWGAWGAFFNAGQTCMAVERVYVVESVYDQFVEKAVHYTRQMHMGFTTAKDSPYYLGPITDPRQLKIIAAHLEDALAKGAQVLTGGHCKDNYVEPTVLTGVNHEMLLMREETFGPLMPIMPVAGEAEAVRMANDNEFGLGASVWSQDIARARRVAGQLEAATVMINDTIAQFAIPMMPFGGIKQSGNGRTHGKQGLLQFTYSNASGEGKPPLAWDVATLARKPGNYALIAGVMRAVFGVTPRQRLQPVAEGIQEAFSNASGTNLKAGAALGAMTALAGIAWAARRSKHHRS